MGKEFLMLRLASTCLVLALASLCAAACEQRDPLYCGMHMDDPRCNLDGGLPEGYVVIGGTVSNLNGGGLILLNNSGDDKPISSSGAFSFATPILQGSTYDVTVGTQPTNPSEMCVVNNGSGTANSDVADVEVTCMPAAYTVGGTVAGFPAGGTIVLTNNGTDDKTITTGGAFTFATPVPSGQPYNVQLKSQNMATCNLVANMGTVGSGPITTIVVVCGSNLYTVGGTPPQGGVTGLNGTVRLRNAGDTITVNSNGAFAFPTPLMGGGTVSYSVSVTQQPAYPPVAQLCTVSNANGTVGTANVTNVGVACATRSFTVGGNVSGLSGTLVLRNGTDMMTIMADGAFTFTNPVQSGLTYAVQVMTQPQGQQCTVTSGSGTVTNANITTVSVTCVNAGVKCGSGPYCTAGSQVCCDPDGSPSCSTASACSAFELPCDDRTDCPNNGFCCAERQNGNLNLESVSCQSSCSNLNNPLRLCDPTKTNQCQSGTTCQAWSQLSGYYVCQ
jgi:hypothetical protein